MYVAASIQIQPGYASGGDYLFSLFLYFLRAIH